MRRLPLFFILDCSESMIGDKLKKMDDGLQSLVRTLRTDPQALETVYISVLAFAGIAQTVAPLVELASFYPPRLPIGGGTSLGAAMDLLMAEIDRSVVKTTPEKKGDWKPIVYLFTDGRPTDNPNAALDRWKSEYARRATLIAIGLGQSVDFSVLQRATDQVIQFEDSQPGDFKRFIDWVSASVMVQSKHVNDGADNALPVLDPSIMRLLKDAPSKVADESCVTLVGRCSKTKKPYLIKYEQVRQQLETRDFSLPMSHFELAGCYALDEDYFAWSDTRAISLQVNTSELVGTPGCPHCGNISAFAACACGKLMCVNGPQQQDCPWCSKQVAFSGGNPGESHEFDVVRGRG